MLVLRDRFLIPCVLHMDDLIVVLPADVELLPELVFTIIRIVVRWMDFQQRWLLGISSKRESDCSTLIGWPRSRTARF